MDLICSPLFFKLSSYFCELIQKFELKDAFTGDGPLTVLVPTDDAFEALKGHEVFGFDKKAVEFDDLTSDETSFLLLYHVINTQDIVFTYDNLGCRTLTETANGEKFRIRCDGDGDEQVKILRGPNNPIEDMLPEIENSDITVCNGVVHFLSNVMLPNLDKLK